jgi:hypothetical protein
MKMSQLAKSRSRNRGAASGLRVAFLIWLGLTARTVAWGQGSPTAARLGNAQIGGGFVFGKSTNTQAIPSTQLTLPGFALYAVLDPAPHFGFEADFRQINNQAGSNVYQRTYEVGGRYVLPLRNYAFNPYAKLLYGRGVYNYPGNVATLAYNMYTAGAGADVRVSYSFNLRVDYEYQTWMSFPRGDLHPSVLSVGVAYHFE